MSVVLNALRAKEAARTAARPSARAQEGLFVANDMPKTSKNAMRLGVLLACLFFAIVFATFRLSALYFSASPQMPAAKIQVPGVAAVAPAIAPAVTVEQAKTLFAEGKLDESLAAFESLAQAHPKDALLRNNMALILMKQERSLEAENRLREAVGMNPDCAECYNTLGLLATQKGYSMQAERHFMKAMDLNDDYAEPYFNLAVLLEKNGDEAGAIAHFEDFLKRTKNKESAIARQVKRHLQKLNS